MYVSYHVIFDEYVFPYQTPTLVQYPFHTPFINLLHQLNMSWFGVAPSTGTTPSSTSICPLSMNSSSCLNNSIHVTMFSPIRDVVAATQSEDQHSLSLSIALL